MFEETLVPRLSLPELREPITPRSPRYNRPSVQLRNNLVRCVLVLALTLAACRTAPVLRPDHPRLSSGVRMQDVLFHSAALNRDMSYRVFLPAQIAPSQRLPVVYLLHGFGDDWRSWSNFSNVSSYAAHGLILVMIDGGISYYMNEAAWPRKRYEDYFLHDLIADVDARFPTVAVRSGRGIVGISMGGFASLKFAFTRPDLFSFAAALSAPVDILHRPFRLQRWGEWWRIRQIFGPRESVQRQSRDPLSLVQTAAPAKMPYIYLGQAKTKRSSAPFATSVIPSASAALRTSSAPVLEATTGISGTASFRPSSKHSPCA